MVLELTRPQICLILDALDSFTESPPTMQGWTPEELLSAIDQLRNYVQGRLT